MAVNKIFLFDNEIVKYLEEITKFEGKTESEIIQEAIEERYKQYVSAKKVDAELILTNDKRFVSLDIEVSGTKDFKI